MHGVCLLLGGFENGLFQGDIFDDFIIGCSMHSLFLTDIEVFSRCTTQPRFLKSMRVIVVIFTLGSCAEEVWRGADLARGFWIGEMAWRSQEEQQRLWIIGMEIE